MVSRLAARHMNDVDLKYPSPLIIEASDTPLSVFAKQFHRRLSKLHTALVAIENNSVKVVITTRLTFWESGLPSTWSFCNRTYAIELDYQSGPINWDEPPDESARVIKMLRSSNPTNRPYTLGLKHTLESFIHAHRAELSVLSGISLVFLHEVLPDSSVIIVLVTDWEHSKAIENATKGLVWGGVPVHIVRDRCMDLISGEEFLPKLLVGSRGGEGGMTVGALLKDRNAGDECLMLQCAHGYEEIGRFPSPNCPIMLIICTGRQPCICTIGFDTYHGRALC